MKALDKNCLFCKKKIFGRPDKKYCDQYCKSAHHYELRKENESLFFSIDRTLKKNRTLLKKYNAAGKAMIRKEELLGQGFNPKYFTHYWKNHKGKVYLFCYEFGFTEMDDNKRKKYLLIQHQKYMD